MTINHFEIERLDEKLFDKATRQSILEIAQYVTATSKTSKWRSGYQGTIEPIRGAIQAIDDEIGGIGISRLMVKKSGTYTGDYPAGERPIHRPLQYALIHAIHRNAPREAIMMSCDHIEGILKKVFRDEISNITRKPLGRIVSDLRAKGRIKEDVILDLEDVVTILNIAKHDFSESAVRIQDSLDSVESQVFNTHEAISMYFICRRIGVQLQDGS